MNHFSCVRRQCEINLGDLCLYAIGLGLVSGSLPQPTPQILGLMVLLTLLLISASIDVRSRIVPNTVTYPGILWFLTSTAMASLLAAVSPNDLVAANTYPIVDSMIASVVGLIVCFAVMFLVYFFTNTGAGDVKLCAVVGAALGAERGVASILWCLALAGLASLGFILFRLGVFASIRLAWRATVARYVYRLSLPLDSNQQAAIRGQVPLAAFLLPATVIVLLEEMLR